MNDACCRALPPGFACMQMPQTHFRPDLSDQRGINLLHSWPAASVGIGWGDRASKDGEMQEASQHTQTINKTLIAL